MPNHLRLQPIQSLRLAPNAATSVRAPAAPVPRAAVLQATLHPSRLLAAQVRDRLVEGLPRERLEVPVCATAKVEGESVFEEAANGQEKLYLPRYELATTGTGSEGERYRLVLETDGSAGFRLVAHLRRRPARWAEDRQGVAALDHHLELRLEVQQGDGAAALRKWTFDEVTESGEDGVRAVLRLASTQERDLVFLGLTQAGLGCRLVAERSVRVAVPLSGSAAASSTSSLAARPAAARVAVAAATRRTIEDRRQRRPVGWPAAQPPRYRVVERVLDQVLEPQPFVFPPALHGYVTAAITGVDRRPGLVARRVSWQGATHSYYQDLLEPNLFYVLPDRFQIARAPQPPHRPQLTAAFETRGEGLEEVTVSLELVAVPVVDGERLAAAAERLAGWVDEGWGAPRFLPLQASGDAVRFRLGLPGPAPFQERPGARIDLDEQLSDKITLPLDDFRQVFEAFLGASAVLLTGEVLVEVSAEERETIPFVGRLDQLAGEVLATTVRWQAEGDVARATLINVVESPLEIHSLGGWLERDGEAVAAAVSGLAIGEPVRLAPGESLAVEVRPATPLAGRGAVALIWDLSGVALVPDRAALWQAVVDPATPAEYLRAITVRSFAAVFEAPADADDQILALVVDFESGAAVELGPDQLEATAILRMPLRDLVLGAATDGAYRYRVTAIRRGSRSRHEDWRPPETTGILFPEVPT